MKHPERVEDYLDHIARAIQRASEYTERLGSVSAFMQPARGCGMTGRTQHVESALRSGAWPHEPCRLGTYHDRTWMPVVSHFLIPGLVLAASSAGGAWSAWRMCFGRWRNGLRTLAATAVVVGVLVAAGSTSAHGAATGIRFATFLLVIALLFSVPIAIVRLARFVVSRAFGEAKVYWRNLARDLGQIVAHRSDDSEVLPRIFSKHFRVTVTVLLLICVITFGLNAKRILAFASQIAPRLSVVTNVLDLFSFTLATPKFFTAEVKDSMLRLYMLTLQSYTFGRVQFPRNAFTYSLGALLFLCTFSLFPFLSDRLLNLQDIEFQQLLAAFNARGFPVAGYLIQPMAEDQEIFAKMWIFLGPVMLVFLVISISVIFLSSRPQIYKAKQDDLADKALFWAVVIFAYSRALSMMA